MGCPFSTPRVIRENTALKQQQKNQVTEDTSKSKQSSGFSPSQGSEQIPKPSITQSSSYSQDWGNYLTFSAFVEQSTDPCLFQYRFIRKIGHGSHAKVYETLNTETGITYASKVYDKSLLNKQSIGGVESPLTIMLTEIEIMSNLDHPNCVHLEEVIEDDCTNSILLIMTFADRGCLIPHSECATPFSEAESRSIFKQLCSAVEYLHSHGFIHRDIKPENVLFMSDGTVLLSDFSASAILHCEDALFEDTNGTPAFFSPEECTGNPFYGKPVDIWALGVTLYVILFGHLPFYKDEADGGFLAQFYSIAQKIIHQDVVFDDNIKISPELRDLFDHILDKDPKTRFTIQQIIVHPWLNGD